MSFEDDVAKRPPGQTILDAPMSELVKTLGIAVADAQAALDTNSIRMATRLGMTTTDFDDGQGNTVSKSLLQLGFMPTFYHFTQATLSVSLTITMKIEEGIDAKLALTLNTADKSSAASDKAGTGDKGSTTATPVTITVKDVTKLVDDDKITIGPATLTLATAAAAGKIEIKSDAAAMASAIADAIGKDDSIKDKVAATADKAVVTLTRKDIGGGDLTIAAPNTAALTVPNATLKAKQAADAGAAGGKSASTPSISITVKDATKIASGNTLKVGLTTLTFGNSAGAGAIEIKGSDADAQAAAIAAAIGAITSVDVTDKVTATAAKAIVTLARKGAGGSDLTVETSADAAALDIPNKTLKAAPADSSPAKTDDGKVAGLGSELQTINKVIPFGIAASAEYHRKYSFDTTSMAKIDATMVSVPPPATFLDQLKAQFGLTPKP